MIAVADLNFNVKGRHILGDRNNNGERFVNNLVIGGKVTEAATRSIVLCLMKMRNKKGNEIDFEKDHHLTVAFFL